MTRMMASVREMLLLPLLFSLLWASLVRSTTTEIDVLDTRDDAVTGDVVCGWRMCVNATLSGDTVTYALSNIGLTMPGWMAIGWGPSMRNTPMAIMWKNADGSMTLSQRMTDSYSMPQVIDDSPKVLTVVSGGPNLVSGREEYVFTVPHDGDLVQYLIFAWSSSNPGSSEVDTPITIHEETGHVVVNLSKKLRLAKPPKNTAAKSSPTKAAAAAAPTPSSSISTTTTTSDSKTSFADSITTALQPLNGPQRYAFAHGIFCSIGFLVFLPAGALAARWVRTLTPAWYTAHWIAQFALAGPAILIGVAFGVEAINNSRAVVHLNDPHKKLGVTLVVLYIFQCALGGFIHWVKPKNSTRRPLQNYLHAIVGIIIVALGFYQVRDGFKREWPMTTGREQYIYGIDVAWDVWVVLLPILYFAGLTLLPKQLLIEKGGAPRTMTEKALPEDEQDSLLAESADEVVTRQYRD